MPPIDMSERSEVATATAAGEQDQAKQALKEDNAANAAPQEDDTFDENHETSGCTSSGNAVESHASNEGDFETQPRKNDDQDDGERDATEDVVEGDDDENVDGVVSEPPKQEGKSTEGTEESPEGEVTTTELIFNDFVDLQTRLVLLPFVQDEGLGAMIEAYADNESVVGHVLIGIGQDDISINSEFTSILADIRQAPVPIKLRFEAPTEMPRSSSSSLADMIDECESDLVDVSFGKDDDGDAATVVKAQPQGQDTSESETPKSNNNAAGSVQSSWSSWVRSSTERAATAMATAAEQAKQQIKQQREAAAAAAGDAAKAEPSCSIFLQSSSGAYLPVPLVSASSKGSTETKITTSSLLLVRASAIAPCPPRGYSYQWYRSTATSPTPMDSSVHSNSVASTTSNSIATNQTIRWVPLDGATHAAFQPNATLVGLRLRCIIRINTGDSDDEDESDLDNDEKEGSVVVCDLIDKVSADSTLFNAARSALVRGAHFGGLRGCGNASGRQFSIEVGLTKNCSKSAKSALTIYQVSGATSEPLTEAPLLHATATVDNAANAKSIQIIPAPGRGSSLLQALCTEDGRFLLEAPNRMTRESFLLSLGIANYKGKPAKLNASTVLYHHDEISTRSLMDDESIASSSCSSSIMSAVATEKAAVPETVGNTSKLEEELRFLRARLARKDKVVSQLQRQITSNDAVVQQTKQQLSECQQDLKKVTAEGCEQRQRLRTYEKKIQSHEATVLRIQGEHAIQISALDDRIMTQKDEIASLEKANKALQNEKAVLTAAVDARETKLVKMAELQRSYFELSDKLTTHDALRVEVQETSQRYENLRNEMERVTQLEKQCRDSLSEAQQVVDNLNQQLENENKRTTAVQSQLDSLQKKAQVMKAERNSYKQKNDSLSKEISRLCRGNELTINDVIRIVADHEAQRDEVEELRKQKRKALEEAHLYRTSYEQAKVVESQTFSGTELEARKALQRVSEQERMLSDMTEYINAKEMQMETLRQVNTALQDEIRELARASMGRNEV